MVEPLEEISKREQALIKDEHDCGVREVSTAAAASAIWLLSRLELVGGVTARDV